MERLILFVLAAACGPCWAYSCVDPADRDQRRWFQDEPCPAGLVDLPLPLAPRFEVLVDDTPRALPGLPATEGSRVRWHRWPAAHQHHQSSVHQHHTIRVSPHSARRASSR